MTTVTLSSKGQDKLHCTQRDMKTVTFYTKVQDNSYTVLKGYGHQLHCIPRDMTTVTLYSMRQDNSYTVLRDMAIVTLYSKGYDNSYTVLKGT